MTLEILVDISREESRVLHEQNADTPCDVASLSKLMLTYLLFDSIKSGQATFHEVVTVHPGSRARPNFTAGKQATVLTLLLWTHLLSGNDSAGALGTHLYGVSSEGYDNQACVDAMNAKAVEFGMPATHFDTPSGVTRGTLRSTARDMSTLVTRLYRDHWEFVPLLSIHSCFLQGGQVNSTASVILAQHPASVFFKGGRPGGLTRHYAGVASRKGRTVAAVCLGSKGGIARDGRMMMLLEKAYTG